jgi:hypothetical protein
MDLDVRYETSTSHQGWTIHGSNFPSPNKYQVKLNPYTNCSSVGPSPQYNITPK